MHFYYQQIYSVTQSFLKHDAPNIRFQDFEKFCFIYSQDLSASGALLQNYLPLLKSGSFQIRIDFTDVSSEIYNALVFGFFPSMLTIDHQKRVVVSCMSGSGC